MAKLERLLRQVSHLDQEGKKNQKCMNQLVKILDQQLSSPTSLLWKEIKNTVMKNNNIVKLAIVQLDQNIDYSQLASISDEERKELILQLENRWKIPECDFTSKDYFSILLIQDTLIISW